MNLRNRILLTTIIINLIVIISIYFIVKLSAYNTISTLTDEYATNLLKSATLSIKNQYTSLEYHKKHATKVRKIERQQIMGIAKSMIDIYNKEYLNGKITKSEAQKKAIQAISKFRYDNGNGYIWINNTQKPIPRIIYHPIFPEFNGKLSDHPTWYTSKDSNNIAGLAVEACEKNGSGFIEYKWKKPSQINTEPPIYKTSYVELYEPWQWVLGTGIYIEDIEQDASNRLNAIKQELMQTMGTMKLGNTGYFYIFNSNKELVLHPFLQKALPESMLANMTKNVPYDEIMHASKTPGQAYTYKWFSPYESGMKNDDHLKKVFVEYFEPLDWYVCVSFYYSELERPGLLLGRKILFISAIFILLTLIAIFYLSNTITKPLNKLIHFVSEASKNFRQANLNNLPHFKTFEANALSKVIKDMLISIKNQHNSLIEEKNKALESEARLRDSEIKFRTLFESTNDSIFLIKESKIISFNQRTLELFKCNEEEILNMSMVQLSAEYQLDGQLSGQKGKRILEDALNGIPQVFEWQYQRPNGETFIAFVSLSLVELGNEKYVQSSIHDITDRKNHEIELEEYRKNLEKMVEKRTRELNQTNLELSEKNKIIGSKNIELQNTLENLEKIKNQLQQAEQLYHSVFDFSPLAIFVFNKDGVITECNDLFVEVNGAPREKLIGLNLLELPEQKMIAEVKRTLKEGSGYFEDYYTSAVSDRSGYYRILYTAFRDAEENIYGGIGMLEDITERKNIETEKEEVLKKWVTVSEELKEANLELKTTIQHLKDTQSQLIHSEKMASLGILTAGVAHEINNPLNFVQNGTLALKTMMEADNPENKEKFQTFFDAITTGTKRITAIVKSLSKYSRSQKNNKSLCNISEILDNCLTMLHNQYKNNVEIVKNYGENIPVIEANEGELHQVFLNIIGNAIQAIPEKGHIQIETNANEKVLQVKIIDNGIGIEQKNIKHLFDPFYTTKEPGKGTGLGLSITKKLIEEHNGTISCTSKVGVGTTFVINLPLK